MRGKRMIRFLILIVLLLMVRPEVGIYAQGDEPTDITPNGEVTQEIIRADISPMMSYQGRLVEDGVPVTGDRNMTFSLWDSEFGGNMVWLRGLETINVTNGLFQVDLGPFEESVIDDMDQELWLRVTVEGVSLPVQRLMGAPYAFSLAPGANIEGSLDEDVLAASNYGTGVGIYGYSQESIGIYGYSVDGIGVEGYSSNGRAISAYSHGPTSAIYARSNNSEGTAIYASVSSNKAALISSNSRSGGEIFEGYGEDSEIVPEFVMENDGTVKQAPEADGLVKAGTTVNCSDTSSSISSSFSTVIDADPITIDNSTSHGTGACIIDLGFDLTGRYWIAQTPVPAPVFSNCAKIDDTKLWCQRYDFGGTGIDGYLTLLVY